MSKADETSMAEERTSDEPKTMTLPQGLQLNNLRNFRTNKKGRTVAIDSKKGTKIELTPYMARLSEFNPLVPPESVVTDKHGDASAADFAKLSLEGAKDKIWEAEAMRLHFMFVRAQDACRELFVSLSMFIVTLREARTLCEKTPFEISEQIKYDATRAMVLFAFNYDEVNKFCETGCRLEEPTLQAMIANSLESAQKEFNKLPKYVMGVAREMHKLGMDREKAMKDIERQARDTARHVIELKGQVERCVVEAGEVVVAIKAYGVS